MPHRLVASGWALVGSVVLGTCAHAEPSTTSRDGFYQPGRTQQLPPLRVEVLDGRRFRDIETGTVYRLYGIDTCAPGQTARLGRQPWPCGATATAWLVKATLDRWLSCAPVRDEDGERLARCASAAHPDLAVDMIRDGVAVALPATDVEPAIRAYGTAEQEARKSFRGLWASTFQMPWEFRAATARDDRPSSHVPVTRP